MTTRKKTLKPIQPIYPVDYDTKIRSGCTLCGLLNGHTFTCPAGQSRSQVKTPLDPIE